MTPDNPIFWQDEILQVMFWMRGEGLGEAVSLAEINRFLQLEPPLLTETLETLVTLGSLEYAPDDRGERRVRLTSRGIEEGKKRFKEEFEGYLGHESHLVCDDPNCDCHDPDFEGVCHHLLDEGKPRH